MDETKIAKASLHPRAIWWPEECEDKLRPINSDSLEGTSTSFGSSSEHERQAWVSQRTSQSLWATGKLAEPIPDGFYFVSPERRFKELFDTLPTLEYLASLDLDGLRPSVILVDSQKDKKLEMLKQLTLSLVKGLGPNAMIKKIAGLVCDVYNRPNMKGNQVKGTLEEISHVFDNQGVHLLGQIKHGSCHSKSILFKVLADVAGLDSRLIVGLPKEGVMDQTDSYKHMSTTVFVNSVEMLVDLVHSPGKLVPCSMRTIFLSHMSSIGDSDSLENDSYDSPIEPNSPVCVFADQVDFEGTEYLGTSPSYQYKPEASSNMSGPSLRSIALRSRATTEQNPNSPHSEPNIANSFWPRSSKKVVVEPGTSTSSPERPSSRKVGRSLLGSKRHSFREYNVDLTASRSAGASPIDAHRRRRHTISMVPEVGDDIVRAVRAMNETLKQNRQSKEEVDEPFSCNTSEQDSLDLQEYVSEFHPDNHDSLYGQKRAPYNFRRKQPNQQRAMSMPSSPHYLGNGVKEAAEIFGGSHIISTLDKVFESKTFSKPLLPFQEWNIDFSEISVGRRVGIGLEIKCGWFPFLSVFIGLPLLQGFFGEVFCGIWNGINVAIKVFLEQDLTVDNIEDFCNEIFILGRIRHPNGACMKPPRLSIVTEYMEMGSLYYLIHVSGQKKRIKLKRRLKMLCDICRGLMCIHRMKIAHRDLKSANCLVNKHWKVKICDFGLSRVLTARPIQDSASAGTPEWMAPELIRNEPFTEKCDIFSLGVIIWELCTLRKPWEGIPPSQVVYAVAHDGKRLEIPEGPLGELISDCWAEAEDRPSCQEILARLIECQCSLF
ncbi:non-receptor serine/threonine protein kinase [Lithospermum erythrorhizon]|uniref:Non-receptor serine/threonine protein kinase n=1 Tax=Lithospermum erythrorhizon TaxID=34254 RepID=A0AAV3QA85_LITER